MLALRLFLAALACPVSAAGQGGPEALAERLLRAPEAEWRQLLTDPEFGSVEVARALLALGEKARLDADFPRTLLAFQTAEAVAQRAGAEKEMGEALGRAANILYAQGKLDSALTTAEQSLRVRERLDDQAGQAEAWNTIGHVKFGRAEYQEALASYRKAAQLWTSAGDRRGAARALNNIGNVHRARAEFDEALGHYQQALRVFEELDDRRGAATVANSIGLVHFGRGEYPQALEYCRRSLAMREASGDRYGIATSFDSLGNIYRGQGAYARALDSFHRSLKLRQEIGDKFATAETWNNIGLVHFSQGDYRLAIDAYKRGLRLSAEIGGTSLTAEGLYNIAAAAWRLGERRRAAANYRESLRICERDVIKGVAAANLHDLGRMALEEGRHTEARALLERALEAREAFKDQAGIAEALNGLASVRLAAKRPGEALELAGRAAEIARRFEQAEQHWEAETLSGVAQRRLGQTDAARSSFEEAVQVIEGLRLQVVGRIQGREQFFESKLSPYHELMALALARGSPEEALALAERSKARALSDLLRRGDVGTSGALSAPEKRDHERLRAALATLNLKVQAERQREAPDEARLASLDAERRARRSEYEILEAAVYARRPALAAQRGGVEAFTLADVAPIVHGDSVAVLEYAVTEGDAHLFVLTRSGGRPKLEHHALGLGRRQLDTLVRRLRERLIARDLLFARQARELHDRLLGPAQRTLAGKTHLVVIPDGSLWEVPFQALTDAAGRYVIESSVVSYAPSLTVLRESLRPRASGGRRTLLAMGKADSSLGPLPDAERQVRAIAALYGPDRSAAYLGPDAREDRFKAEAPLHAIVHLATHGVLDESSPLYSHVVLSPGSGGSSEDGLLEAWEMLDLNLAAEVVVLSACETGRGRVAPGEGVVGTMWALLVAGSKALVVSQWKVESASTTELMTAFHRGLARGDGAKAAHLRQASLEFLRQPRYAHPFYWAGFVLVGNPY